MTGNILLKDVDVPDIREIDVYEEHGGYQALRQTLELEPETITRRVKESGLRGRGGAGFPTGLKWSFVPKDVFPKYLVCNAAEGEPGTFKDRQIMENNPHQLLEGIAICAYAVGAETCYIYVRGEFFEAYRQLRRAATEAENSGYLGQDVLGSNFSLQVRFHREGGAYICGEETSLLESLEGKLGQPRVKPPFPANAGLYQKPTVINNVETLSCLPPIIHRGADWFTNIGTEKSPGPKIFSLSGHVNRPGNYELPLGTSLRELIFEHGGGIPDARSVKAVIPGGSSAQYLTADHLDVGMDFESLQEVGSMLGSGAVMVMDETTCMVWATWKILRFFSQESCGKCTPCREGTYWAVNLLDDMVHGRARERDIDILNSVGDQIIGNTLCPLGDAAVSPIASSLKYWRDEYEYHVREGRCPVNGHS